ncbi:type II toxin-antitoxin system HicA family toxin [Enterococcus pallens]|uniref:Addiction module toxin, HicA family n=1 Tax=Enterococcus pallens ATCC BAA-351 TaxID=1158607 RepID=R2QRU9_9ENTE|nr:type II toxin-antitoxin system HicA family toxin [Enterococcus pallens]EOH97913.1 hypothetical protein UAU_00581 [Enterococcus pallens ATCC BAA-351]EOU20668.1 hypothetical protein I588_01515 [Enterococcus pallens ATCC BAA-351]OJG79375.1 hypothetical protein RV10_GL000877 [Enterococcus pallens]
MKAKEMIKLLESDGWYEKNQKGSHRHFLHPTKKGKVTVPEHGSKDIPKGTANNILSQAGLR